jgi:hypothetical protein
MDLNETNTCSTWMQQPASHTLTMQVMWVVTVEASKFFSQMVLQADLEHARPKFAMSYLNLHTDTFAMGISCELAGLPDEWKP